MDFSKELRKLAKEFRKIADPHQLPIPGMEEHAENTHRYNQEMQLAGKSFEELLKDFEKDEKIRPAVVEALKHKMDVKGGLDEAGVDPDRIILEMISKTWVDSEEYDDLVDIILDRISDDIDMEKFEHAFAEAGIHDGSYRSDDIVDTTVSEALRRGYDLDKLLTTLKFLNKQGLSSEKLKKIITDKVMHEHFNADQDDIDKIFEVAEILDDDTLIDKLSDAFLHEFSLTDWIELYKNSDPGSRSYYMARDEIRYYINDSSPNWIRSHYGSHVLDYLLANGFIEEGDLKDGKDLDPRHVKKSIDVEHLPENHTLRSRAETLTFLKNLIKLSGGKISFKEILEKGNLNEKEDRTAIDFILKQLFSGNRDGSITSEKLDKFIDISKKVPGKEMPLSYGIWGADEGQNTLGRDQLVVKLQMPQHYMSEIRKDPEVTKFFKHAWNEAGNDESGMNRDHPGGIGWIRVGLVDKHSWLIDEVQSDFMRVVGSYRNSPGKLRKIFPELADHTNQEHDEIDSKVMQKNHTNDIDPRNHRFELHNELTEKKAKLVMQKIDKIINELFGHWTDILMSAVLEIARQNGVTDVYMHTAESVEGKSDMSSKAKMNRLYEQLPAKTHFKKEDVRIDGKNMYLWHRHAFKSKRARDLVRLAHLLNSME